jgi:hypothetical protein
MTTTAVGEGSFGPSCVRNRRAALSTTASIGEPCETNKGGMRAMCHSYALP